MKPEEFCKTVFAIPEENKKAFWDALKEKLTEEEYSACYSLFFYFEMAAGTEKANAVKAIVLEKLWNEINGGNKK